MMSTTSTCWERSTGSRSNRSASAPTPPRSIPSAPSRIPFAGTAVNDCASPHCAAGTRPVAGGRALGHPPGRQRRGGSTAERSGPRLPRALPQRLTRRRRRPPLGALRRRAAGEPAPLRPPAAGRWRVGGRGPRDPRHPDPDEGGVVGGGRRRPACGGGTAARRRGRRLPAGDLDGDAGHCAAESPPRGSAAEDLQEAHRGEGRHRRGEAGGDRRAAGTERGGEDHDLLPHHRADPSRRRHRDARWAGPVAGADVQAGPFGDRLPGAGAVDLPPDDGRGECPRHPRDPADLQGGTDGQARADARRALDQAPPEEPGLLPLRRGTAPPRDHPRPGDRPEVHAPRRTVRGGRPDRGPRHPDHRGGAPAPRDRGPDHRPQRRTDPRHRRSRLHHVRRPGPGRRPGPRPRLRRPGGGDVLRPDPHGPAPRPARGAGPLKAGLGQHTGLRQELRINPRLYQAMDLLTMPMMDLQQHLKQELLVNPFLELEEPEDEVQVEATQKQEKEEAERKEEMDWEEILLNGFDVAGATSGSYEDREYLEPVSVEVHDLDDHLREQLDLLVLAPRQRFLAEQFLGNIGDDGYLQATLEEVIGLANQMLAEEWALRRPDPVDEEGEAEGETAEAPAEPMPPGVKAYTIAE